jgi:hypothetical protein
MSETRDHIKKINGCILGLLPEFKYSIETEEGVKRVLISKYSIDQKVEMIDKIINADPSNKDSESEDDDTKYNIDNGLQYGGRRSKSRTKMKRDKRKKGASRKGRK